MATCIGHRDPTAPVALSYLTRRSRERLANLTPEQMARATPGSISRIARRRIPSIPAATMAVMSQEQVNALRHQQRERLNWDQFVAIAARLSVDVVRWRLSWNLSRAQFTALHESLTEEQRSSLYRGLERFAAGKALRWKDVRYSRSDVVIMVLVTTPADRRRDFFNAYLRAHRAGYDHRSLRNLTETIKHLTQRKDLSEDRYADIVTQLQEPIPVYTFLHSCRPEVRVRLMGELGDELRNAVENIADAVAEDEGRERQRYRPYRGAAASSSSGAGISPIIQSGMTTAVLAGTVFQAH